MKTLFSGKSINNCTHVSDEYFCHRSLTTKQSLALALSNISTVLKTENVENSYDKLLHLCEVILILSPSNMALI